MNWHLHKAKKRLYECIYDKVLNVSAHQWCPAVKNVLSEGQSFGQFLRTSNSTPQSANALSFCHFYPCILSLPSYREPRLLQALPLSPPSLSLSLSLALTPPPLLSSLPPAHSALAVADTLQSQMLALTSACSLHRNQQITDSRSSRIQSRTEKAKQGIDWWQ